MVCVLTNRNFYAVVGVLITNSSSIVFRTNNPCRPCLPTGMRQAGKIEMHFCTACIWKSVTFYTRTCVKQSVVHHLRDINFKD